MDVVTADGELRVVNKDQHPVCENGMKREIESKTESSRGRGKRGRGEEGELGDREEEVR